MGGEFCVVVMFGIFRLWFVNNVGLKREKGTYCYWSLKLLFVVFVFWGKFIVIFFE